jgi:SWIM zinc finger
VAVLEHTYAYRGASALAGGLTLATSGGAGVAFAGWIERPAAPAAALLAVAACARSRFTPGTRVFPDPVVTCHRERLRFESLSSCGGVYARYDLDVPGGVMRPGATNVDVNPPLRAALAAVDDSSPMHLSVGADELVVTTAAGAVAERKVALPLRWIKGLGEVGVTQAAMTPRFELGGVAAARMLRALPRSGRFFVGAGGAVGSARPGAVPVQGAERLRLLAPLLRMASRLRVWDGAAGSSAWTLTLPRGRFHLVLSPEPWRGFSGEGGVLAGLADDGLARLAEGLDLRWEAAIGAGVSEEVLAHAGARGRAGFDLDTGRWFHRDLPFDLGRVPALHPRLAAARALARDGVRLGAGEAWVRGSGGAEHRVVLGEDRCTCPWWGRHAGARGPCKHVLAAQIARDAGHPA